MTSPKKGTPAPVTPSESTIPTTIGRFQVRERLGAGATGSVYLGYDEELHRIVAIKVLAPQFLDSPRAEAFFRTEAQSLAALNHPGIVPIYDVGRTSNGLLYLVSRYIEGCDLKHWLEQGRPSLDKTAEIILAVAEALHHAHQAELVHRDIKPANILMDGQGRSFITDFGFALRREDRGTGPAIIGTPLYMSPEQARGESHRVDARSDIYSLGVVFYELLVGETPFRGNSRDEIFQQIRSQAPRPPRMVDPAIPEELERICLKALEKRASDRYTTALELADDLRQWRQSRMLEDADSKKGMAEAPKDLPRNQTFTHRQQATIQIVPRGLRAYEQEDAEFFLGLLPGPRNRHGLPESIQFWKTRLESTDAERAFSVGLMYGPSGCGKTSLVRAGLLPRLGSQVRAIYIEATGPDTEKRLLTALRNRVPDLSPDWSLAESLRRIRQHERLSKGQKLVLVIDQFEQWLHGQTARNDTGLVEALRQCDGIRVQCLLLVRDDFWLSVSRFMRELEVHLVDGENCALIDLFDLLHGKAVLTELGRAYSRLPPKPNAPTPDQERFLDRAIEGLAQDGKIIPVRLSLFVEMIKSRPWKLATLQELGGAEGLGVAYFEATFSGRSAPVEHRLHEKAIRALLQALLPVTGADIKGNRKSFHELQTVCGYEQREEEFRDLLRILDSKLRIVTPSSDVAGESKPADSRSEPGTRYYQLTHDFLVRPLREWLDRAQRGTRRGRAELLLAERATAWNARPEPRLLPSAWEWLRIRLWTRRKTWTASQSQMMTRASRRLLARCLLLLFSAGLLAWGSWEVVGRLHTRAQRSRYLHAALTPEVRAYLSDLDLLDVISDLPAYIFLKDRNGVYVYINDYYVGQLMPNRDCIGKTDVDLFGADLAKVIRQEDQEVMESGEPRTFRSPMRLPNGTKVTLVVVKAPLRNKAGEIIGIIGTANRETVPR